MATITTQMVKELRDATSVSMMECKNALDAAGGDMAQATKILRERGMAAAVKKAARTANQGLIDSATSADGKAASLVEVNSETDFVARNASFQAFVKHVAELATTTDAALAETLKSEVGAKVGEIGENLVIRRNVRYQLAGTGKLGTYIHLGGKVGVLIEVACGKAETAAAPAFVELVNDLTLQIAASSPRWLVSAEAPADVIAQEREIYAKQVTGKPANIVDKIVDGKLKKFYTDTCLVDQAFVKDAKGTQTITQLIQAKARELGDTIEIKRFVRYQLGA